MTMRARFLRGDEGEHIDVLGSAMTFLATAADTGGSYEVVVVEAGPGGDPIPHRHPWQEFYAVLEGSMEIQVGARCHRAGPGAFVTIPSRAIHSFAVTSDRARFLHVSIGEGAVAAFRDYHEVSPGAPTPESIPALLEINARHGVEVVLPGIGPVRTVEDLATLT